MSILRNWYITVGNAGRLCALPEKMIGDREILLPIKCSGIIDAVEQLKNYEELKNLNSSGTQTKAVRVLRAVEEKEWHPEYGRSERNG